MLPYSNFPWKSCLSFCKDTSSPTIHSFFFFPHTFLKPLLSGFLPYHSPSTVLSRPLRAFTCQIQWSIFNPHFLSHLIYSWSLSPSWNAFFSWPSGHLSWIVFSLTVCCFFVSPLSSSSWNIRTAQGSVLESTCLLYLNSFSWWSHLASWLWIPFPCWCLSTFITKPQSGPKLQTLCLQGL